MKVVLLEGRTDMFYIRKMYELIGAKDEIMYFPCGGASEIWPVVEAFKWRWHSKIEMEAWVDNDIAGEDAQRVLNSTYPFVKVRKLGEDRRLGSIEDLVGFLVPRQFEKYASIEKKRQEARNPKWIKNDYKDAKDDLFAAVMALKTTSEENKNRIRQIFKHFNINV